MSEVEDTRSHQEHENEAGGLKMRGQMDASTPVNHRAYKLTLGNLSDHNIKS